MATLAGGCAHRRRTRRRCHAIAGPATPPRAAPTRWLLIALAVGAFISMADATIVAVGLDPLVHHFAVPLSAGQEVLSVYLVAITATLPTLGRLGDRLGRRRVYLAGFAVFALGSVDGRAGAVVRRSCWRHVPCRRSAAGCSPPAACR